MKTDHISNRRLCQTLTLCAGLALAAAVPHAAAQQADVPSVDVPLGWDSGLVQADPAGHGLQVVWHTRVDLQGAAWLRLRFDEVMLSGVVEEGTSAQLRIVSLEDGAQQFLNAETIRYADYHTAYFNGSALHVELLAHPGAGPSRVVIDTAVVGLPTGTVRSICDGVDLRELSFDPRIARHSAGCTVWMFNDTNRMFGSAGHCGASSARSALFNVPLSTPSGTPVLPPPEDQYPFEMPSVQSQNSGVGQDWMYFATFRNPETGLTAYQAQGDHLYLAPGVPPVQQQGIRITGYGTVSSPVSPTWNQVQKTHVGPFVEAPGTALRYRPDTTGGNSGSPVVDDTTGLVIGVHTHGGCTSSGGANQGTGINHTGWMAAIANPQSLAASGRGTVMPPLFAAGDLINNFGTVDTSSGNFAKIEAVPPHMQGLAYDPDEEIFYGVAHWSHPVHGHHALYSIDPQSGEATKLGDITGTTAILNGLGYDPHGQILYGISQATGQLFRISLDANPGSVIPVGSPGGGTISGLEYNRELDSLFGVDRSTTPARLVTINTGTGAQTVVGSLGGNISNVNGLGAVENGDLYTVDASSGNLIKIDPMTGSGTVVGATGGMWGTALGMSAIIPPGPPPAIRITFPGGLPYLIAPGEGYDVDVNIIPGTQNLQPGTAKVFFRVGGSGSFDSLPLTHVSGDEFTATLPPFACGDEVEIYFSAEGDGGGVALLPRDAPTTVYSTKVGVIVEEPLLDTVFNTSWPTGWSASGVWHVTGGCAPGGNRCADGPWAYFGRSTTCNYNLPTGRHEGQLDAPAVQVPTLPPGGTVKLKFCYALETEEHPSFDKAELFVNGSTRPEWRIEDVKPTTAEPDRYWAQAEFDLTEFAGQTVEVSFRFDTVTGTNNNFRGWHLNNVRLEATQVGCPDAGCYADCDGNELLNVDDFLCFINHFAQGDPYADCDDNGSLNIDDFLCFINEFAQGCP